MTAGAIGARVPWRAVVLADGEGQLIGHGLARSPAPAAGCFSTQTAFATAGG